jgi:multidrug resistance efflux pump
MTKLIVIVAIAGLLVAGVAYNLQPRPAGSGAAKAAATPQTTVSFDPAVVARRSEPISMSGVVKSDGQAVVATTMPARILRVLVRNGDRVRSGQPVVILDSRSSDAQVAQSSAGVSAAEATLRKAIDGKPARIIELDSQVEQARSGLSLARSKLTQAELGATLTESSAESDSVKARAGVKQAEAGLRQASAGFTQASETLKRVRFLYSKGGVSRSELEGAEVQAEIAKANKDAAESAMEQALAAEKPATESRPLRAKVSQAEVDSARAGVRQAQEGLRSAIRARTAAIGLAERDIEAARAQVRQAAAGRTQAESVSTGRTLTSPADGIVGDVAVHAGDVAQPGMPLLSVLGDGPVYFEGAVAARFAGDLSPGLAVAITLDTGTKLRGTIRRVLPMTQDGRTVPVEISLAGSGRNVLNGATGRAQLTRTGN